MNRNRRPPSWAGAVEQHRRSTQAYRVVRSESDHLTLAVELLALRSDRARECIDRGELKLTEAFLRLALHLRGAAAVSAAYV
jgi:hypothetical protein